MMDIETPASSDDAVVPGHLRSNSRHAEMERVTAVGAEHAQSFKYSRWRAQVDLMEAGTCDSFETLVYIHSPTVAHRMDRKMAPASARTLNHCSSSENTLWTSDGEVDFSHFYLSKTMLETIVESELDRTFDTHDLPEFTGEIDLRFAELLEMVSRSVGSPNPSSRLEMDAWGNLIGLRLLEKGRVLTKTNHDQPRPTLERVKLDDMIEWIEANLSDDLSLNSLAEIANLSPHQCCRWFKHACDQTPHQYVIARRIARACEMLDARSPTTLAEIAYSVGFSSQSHMTDLFRKRLGVTPGQYRKQRHL